MRILTVSWGTFYYENNMLNILRNGGSIMIHDIAEYIGRKVESFFYEEAIRIEETDFGNIRIVDNTKYLPSKRTKDNIDEWREANIRRLSEIIDELKPDCIFLHDGYKSGYDCIKLFERKHICFAYVVHLFLKKEQYIGFDESDVYWDQKIFSIDDLNIVTVGNGTKNKILESFDNISEKNVYTIVNGTTYKGVKINEGAKENDRYYYGGKKVLICSGTLHPRKNQEQLVRACALLPERIRKKIIIVFCGRDSIKNPYKERLLSSIEKLGLNDMVKYVGPLKKDEMASLYSRADGLVMSSLIEGVSLVALEMLTYGRPVIMFSDNETAEDVNDPNVVIFAEGHSDQALADAIVEWYERDWDEEYIKEYSKYYNMERVADDYIEYCRKRIEEGK